MKEIKRKVLNAMLFLLVFVGVLFFIGMGIQQKKILESYPDSNSNTVFIEEKSSSSEEERYLISLGFERSQNPIFECTDFLYVQEDGTVISIPTKVSEDTLGVCTIGGIEYELFCPNGVEEKKLGTPDECL